MDTSLRINLPSRAVVYDSNEEDGGYWGLVSRLSWQLSGIANVYTQYEPRPPESGGGPGGPPEILVKLSANATSMLFTFREILRVASKYLNAYEERELIFELEGRKLTLKGHSPQEEIELIQQIFPESLEQAGIRSSTSHGIDLMRQPTLERLQYLKQLYSVSEYESLTVAQVGQELDWDDAVRDEITSYLLDAGFIEIVSSNIARITDAGRLAVEYSVRFPDQMESHLQSGGININVQGDLNVGGDIVGRDKTSSNT